MPLTLPTLKLAGSPTRMGEAFGEACREQIRELTERRLQGAAAFAGFPATADGRARIAALAESCLPIAQSWDREGYEELVGIARGAGVSPAELFAMQGYTDMRDWLAQDRRQDADAEGCSSFIAEAALTHDGHLLAGQTWDLATYNMEFELLVHRQPDHGPATWSLTLAGCLSLIGMNEHGLAIGTTNLRTLDARRGLHYLHLIHRALRCKTTAEALPLLQEAPRMGAHYYYLADAHGAFAGLECSAARQTELAMQNGLLVHCNHVLAPEIASIEEPNQPDSTCHRQTRFEHLLRAESGSLSPEIIKPMLADHDGGDLAICRHQTPPNDVSTNACVILSPATRELHACRGPAHEGMANRFILTDSEAVWRQSRVTLSLR
jgi:isopenicillin-N N-acyltransferase like protein